MLHGTRRALLGARKKYHQRVLGTNPTAYWPMWESSGSVSQDLVLAAQNGVYTGVTLGQPGIGDGRTSPFFDGALDFNNIFSLALQGNFNGAEGTVMEWAKVANAGVWIDGVARYSFWLNSSGFADYIALPSRTATNGEMLWYYRAGGVTKSASISGLSYTDWFPVAVSWSASLDEARAYINGVQAGPTLNGLGVWSGAPVTVVVGAQDTAPSFPWHGYLAHAALWTRPLPPATIKSLAVV